MDGILLTILIAAALVLWFWAITDINRLRFHKPSRRTFWLLLVLFCPMLGPVFYFQFKKRFTTTHCRRFRPDFKAQNARS